MLTSIIRDRSCASVGTRMVRQIRNSNCTLAVACLIGLAPSCVRAQGQQIPQLTNPFLPAPGQAQPVNRTQSNTNARPVPQMFPGWDQPPSGAAVNPPLNGTFPISSPALPPQSNTFITPSAGNQPAQAINKSTNTGVIPSGRRVRRPPQTNPSGTTGSAGGTNKGGLSNRLGGPNNEIAGRFTNANGGFP